MRDLLPYLIFGAILFTSFVIWSDIVINIFNDIFNSHKKH